MSNLPPRNDVSEDRFIHVAVELLQTQNPTAIFMLKQFLTHIPSATRVRNILTAAIVKLVETSPTVVCWLLEHPNSLKPELNIRQTVIQILSRRLEDMGFVQDQDFCINSHQNFEVSEAAQLALSMHSELSATQDPLPIVGYFQKRS